MSEDLSRLFRQYVEQDLSAEEFGQLQAHLQSDRDARRQFVDYMNLCEALDEQGLSLAETSLPSLPLKRVVIKSDSSISWLRLLALSAAACLVLTVVAIALDTVGIVDIFGSGSDNRLATALVKRGLGVQTTLGSKLIYSTTDLPDEPFFIRALNFSDRDGDPFPIHRDDLARWLPPLERLEVLDFTACRLTDDCIPLVVAQPSLQHLNIGATSGLTPDGIEQLAAAPRLVSLTLSGQDRELWPAIAKITQLQRLEMWEGIRAPSHEVIPHLQALRHLERFNANRSPTWNDESLVAITTLPRLRTFLIQNAAITDTGIAEFVTQIEATDHPLAGLYLENCAGITGQSIAGLGRLDQLRSLGLKGSNLTPADIEQLRTRLPNTHIDF